MALYDVTITFADGPFSAESRMVEASEAWEAKEKALADHRAALESVGAPLPAILGTTTELMPER